METKGEVPWRVVAFDLDDTLYPEAEFVRSGFREVAHWSAVKLSRDPDATFLELLDLFDGGIRGTVFDSWVAEQGLSTELIGEMVAVYRNHYPRITPFPGIREMLSELRRDFRLGLLSDGPAAIQERKLSALGIGHQFDAVVFSDRLGRDSWKPSLKPFMALVDALEVVPEEAIYVGDNPAKDFVACRQLGMSSIWFRQSSGIYSNLLPESDSHRPDYVEETVAGVISLLKTGRQHEE